MESTSMRQEHFYARTSVCVELRDDGARVERVRFRAGYADTWIGRTVGRIAIWFAQKKFHREFIHRDGRVLN